MVERYRVVHWRFTGTNQLTLSGLWELRWSGSTSCEQQHCLSKSIKSIGFHQPDNLSVSSCTIWCGVSTSSKQRKVQVFFALWCYESFWSHRTHQSTGPRDVLEVADGSVESDRLGVEGLWAYKRKLNVINSWTEVSILIFFFFH